ncbi:MAG: phage major tail protein, TP901-1 family [Parvularculaceae bacterium]
MTAQRGKDMLVKIGDGATPENFTTVAGLRTRTISLNAREVDITHSESNGWRELLAGAGVRQVSLAGSGVFLNDAAGDQIRAAFFAGIAPNFELTAPGLGTFSGPFLIANLDFAGEHDGEATFSIALASAGAVSFTPAP